MSTLALAAIQLALTPGDLRDERTFAGCVERAARAAARACGPGEHRLLVFPETIGHFAPLAYAPAAAQRQPTMARALAVMALRRPGAVLRTMAATRTADVARAVMLALLPRADALMRRLFASVAREHRAYVVAGSHLRAVANALTNTSYTFDPAGRLVAATHKANLVPGLEDGAPGGLDLTRGDADELPVVQTPWGGLATLICYDGFCRPHTRREPFVFAAERADARGAGVIANPAANPWPWNGRWVHAEPGSTQLRCEQWRAEGLPATLRRLRHARYGVTAHLCARILDFRFEGKSHILARNDQDIEVLSEASREDAGEIVAARVPLPTAGGDLTRSYHSLRSHVWHPCPVPVHSKT